MDTNKHEEEEDIRDAAATDATDTTADLAQEQEKAVEVSIWNIYLRETTL